MVDELVPDPSAPVVLVDATETLDNPPFTAALHPDDAVTRCAEILDNMHGSDDMRRKVVAALVERFAS